MIIEKHFLTPKQSTKTHYASEYDVDEPGRGVLLIQNSAVFWQFVQRRALHAISLGFAPWLRR
jgi:hypothetical protein